jgi:hypothetical protein
MVHLILGRNGDATIEPMNKPAYEAAPKESYGDIARIVDTQIKTGIAVNQRVSHQETGKQSLSHQQGEEDGDAERIGSMSREEAVIAPTIAVHYIHQRTNLRIVSGSPTSYKRFDDTIVNGSCQQVTQSCCTQNQQNVTNILV